ncbi:hypothetical protein SAMN04487819_109213 [Actinopolyspora alba]|uniref:Uncharacterized protein n=1 Tax=Actinopolyspora alba TaxID=673379 RepID=A0A1I1YSU1_9ACTN|nr:hypothetical protein SAMN04487819_109213 [Actinopolyspora alba]
MCSIHVAVTRYATAISAPRAEVLWEATYHGIDELTALELHQGHCDGPHAADTLFEAADDLAPLSVEELVRRAYAHGRSTPSVRERFLEWFLAQVRRMLLPDEETPSTPPGSRPYWSDVACWAAPLLDPIDEWLDHAVATAYGTALSTMIARHEAELAAHRPSCRRHTAGSRTPTGNEPSW